MNLKKVVSLSFMALSFGVVGNTQIPALDLTGVIWTPQNTVGQFVTFNASGTTNPTGAITGFGGCSNFAALYYQDNQRIQTLDFTSSIQIPCTGITAIQSAFFTDLQNMRSVEIVGGDLLVYDPNDQLILTLSAN